MDLNLVLGSPDLKLSRPLIRDQRKESLRGKEICQIKEILEIETVRKLVNMFHITNKEMVTIQI